MTGRKKKNPLQLAQAIFKWVGRFGNVTIQNPSALTSHYKYIFILSHMRGYTSLLSHILGSHPEISGYFELHQSYRNSLDLILMRVRVADGLNYQIRGQYILDKILHQDCILSPNILHRDDLYTIFVLRKPEPTLKSLKAHENSKDEPYNALKYYLERLDYLKNLSNVPRNRIYLDGESLLENTNSTLEFIRSCFQLKEEISSSYSIFKFTGKRGGYGDWSDFIMQGKIVYERNYYDEIKISPGELKMVTEAYDDARCTMKQTCSSL